MLALLADIHANVEALDACLKHAREVGATRYAFLGDLVGYGADPQRVVDTVMRHAAEGAVVVQGNHDAAVFKTEPGMSDGAAEARDWTRAALDDERQPAIQWATRRILSLSSDFRLICVSVIAAAPLGGEQTQAAHHIEHLVRLRNWTELLPLSPDRLSQHVIQAADPSAALLEFAKRNHVDLIVLGAPGPRTEALAWWRSVASGVTANAHCSVYVVRVPEKAEPEEGEP